jgi:hypothetical protein
MLERHTRGVYPQSASFPAKHLRGKSRANRKHDNQRRDVAQVCQPRFAFPNSLQERHRVGQRQHARHYLQRGWHRLRRHEQSATGRSSDTGWPRRRQDARNQKTNRQNTPRADQQRYRKLEHQEVRADRALKADVGCWRLDSGAIQARWRNPRNVVCPFSSRNVHGSCGLPVRFTVRVALSQADRPAAATRTPGTPRRLTKG